MPHTAEFTKATYDKVASAYDHLFSDKVAPPNERLTAGLQLARGQRLADLACGTGIVTVEMARRVAPGEVVAVDWSEGMLATARERAEEEGLHLTLVHARAEDFVFRAEDSSFDVVSMRFALVYLDWPNVLPRMGRMLKPGGRVGVLTSTTSSIPQFYELFDRFRSSFTPVWKLYKHCNRSVGDTLKLYRRLRETFADGKFISVPESAQAVADALSRGGLAAEDAWTERVRLWFHSGVEAVQWIRNSGYATHETLARIGPDGVRFIEALFAAGLEGFREPRGIPLDLVVSGVVARRR